MITRIVHLCFNPEFAEEFKNNFGNYQKIVLSNPGCLSVKLQKDINSNSFFTISTWESEQDLNFYRNSEKFKEIWKILKPNFVEPAKAWTTFEIHP